MAFIYTSDFGIIVLKPQTIYISSSVVQFDPLHEFVVESK